MRRALLLSAVAATALLVPHASAASTALVVADPTGDANFSGVHGQSLPASEAPLDIVSVTFDTTKTVTTSIVKKKKVTTVTPTGIKITLTLADVPATVPGASYGINATHSVCGQMRLQIYYSPDGATPYGDLADCGENTDPTATNASQFGIDFTPKVVGKSLVIEVPFKRLPKAFKVGTLVDEISAYTSTAEFVVAGYQPTDFEPSAGVDVATADRAWKVA
jgi:hypothetical protein